jgi:hypothetical protein
MKIPSRIVTGAALFAAVLSPSFAQTTATTKPVGYRTETLKGGGIFNLLSPNLDNAVGAAGTIDVIATTTLTDNEANFAAAFTAGEPLTLKIVDGANAGIITDVTAFTATTLTTADDISSLIAAGVKYEVRKTPTVASLFGATNSANLLGGASGAADIIWIPAGAGTYTQVFYSTGGLPGVGWRRVGGGATNAANDPISIVDGIFIQRRGATDLSVVFTGHVQTTATKTGVTPGFNPLSRVIPVDLKLVDSGLQNELAQGTSGTADLIWNPVGDGTYAQLYYSNGGLAGVGWRQVGSGNADRAETALKSGFLVQRKSASGTNVTLRIPPGLDI